MSAAQIRQLVDMGASVAQAKAALAQCKDVEHAAERFFDGAFDHVKDVDAGEDVEMNTPSASSPSAKVPIRMMTPDDDEGMDDDDEEAEGDEDDDGDDFIDYDSDDGGAMDTVQTKAADPYANVFFSKDHQEEIIEVDEDAEYVALPGVDEPVRLLTQGEWMRGCPPPSGGEQGFLFSQFSQLSNDRCKCPNECGTSIPRTKGDFFVIFPDFLSYISHLKQTIQKTCPECKTDFCFACGEPITEKVQRPGAAASTDPVFHCADIQGVILGVGLSMLEQIFSEQVKEVNNPPDTHTRSTKRRKISGKTTAKSTDDDEDDSPVSYMSKGQGSRKSGAKGGTGYAGDLKEDDSGQVEAQALQAANDERIGKLLTDIGVYLPSLNRDGHHPSDFLPHPTALAHLRRRFNFVCSALLKNDSLADMSDRSVLYFKLLDWLETISSHEALASMMAMPIMTISSVKSVTTRKSPNNATIRERTVVYEGSASPRELLEAMVIQATAALKALEVSKPPPVEEELTEEQKRMTVDVKGKSKQAETAFTDETQKLYNFCQRIISTADAIDRSLLDTKGQAFLTRLKASLPKVITSSSGQSAWVDPGTTEESAIEAYLDWATRVRFEYCDLTVPTTEPVSDQQLPHYKSYYNNEIRMLAMSDIPKRSLAIAKELSILTNNLPTAWNSSIFLRIDETRVDVIKALITGPEGTPYYNGCYLFDIFLGPSYNQAPPSVKYMTTNGGKFRFNPNLYADGKVCLSLLGTWSGPGWVAGKSTLLQVLISIQSMILCDEPYLNEPGWANDADTPQSRSYSANVRRMVVKTAMLGNLQNPPEPFRDIIRTHFRLKAQSICKQLDEWLGKDDGKSTQGEFGVRNEGATQSSNGLGADVTELKRMLRVLEAEKSK